MVIQEHKQLGLRVHNNSDFQGQIFGIHFQKYIGGKNLGTTLFRETIAELVDFVFHPSPAEWEKMKQSDPNFRDVSGLLFPKHQFYLFSENAIAATKTIKIDLDKFEPGIIGQLQENRMCTFLCGPNLAFKYWFKKGCVLGMIMEVAPQADGREYFTYASFRIRVTDNSYYYPMDVPYTATWKHTYFVQFLQMLFFLEFSDPEFVTLRPNQTHGTKKSGKILNASKGDVTVVNSAWNKIFKRDEGFTVSPHLRWQPYGQERKFVKLIYIDAFQKHGYERKGLGTLNKE